MNGSPFYSHLGGSGPLPILFKEGEIEVEFKRILSLIPLQIPPGSGLRKQ